MTRQLLAITFMLLAGSACYAQTVISAGGISATLPEGWTAEEDQNGTFFLLPPDRGREIYLLGEIQGRFESVRDANLKEQIIELLKQLLPELTLVSDDALSGTKRVMTFRCQGWDNANMKSNVTLIMINNKMLGAAAIGSPEALAENAGEFDALLNSIRKSNATDRQVSKTGASKKQRSTTSTVQNGELDSRLVGKFKFGTTSAPTEGIAVSTVIMFSFESDGRVYLGSQSAYSAWNSESDVQPGPNYSASGTTDENTRVGTWTTEGDILTIDWGNGETIRVKYSFYTNGELVARNPQTNELINYYERIK